LNDKAIQKPKLLENKSSFYLQIPPSIFVLAEKRCKSANGDRKEVSNEIEIKKNTSFYINRNFQKSVNNKKKKSEQDKL
jgi:hypothetical protein